MPSRHCPSDGTYARMRKSPNRTGGSIPKSGHHVFRLPRQVHVLSPHVAISRKLAIEAVTRAFRLVAKIERSDDGGRAEVEGALHAVGDFHVVRGFRCQTY